MNALARAFTEPLTAWIDSRLGRRLRKHLTPEDLAQETFFLAFKGIGQFRGEEEPVFWSWIKTIAIRRMQKEARLREDGKSGKEELSLHAPIDSPRGSPDPLEAILEGTDTTPSQQVRRQEKFDRLQDALQSLSPDHRKVILLANVELLPIREIAQRMNRSPPAVSMLLYRALTKLREAFGKMDSTDSFDLPHDRSLKGEGD